MEKRILAGLAAARLLRPLFAGTLVFLAGRTFNASGQTLTGLYSFTGAPDGDVPYAGLVQASDGNFYGTTFWGGTYDEGTVFRISPSGTYTSLYSFAGYPTDGQNPFGELVQGSDGNFYGTTSGGGTSSCEYVNVPFPAGDTVGGCGTVFRISPSGNYTSLYSFGSSPNDGSGPSAGLVQGSDGNFYGTTYQGGTYTVGTVFRISPSGSYTSLYSFGTPNDGWLPIGGLVQGSDGNFYGTTRRGGTNAPWEGGPGTVFRISPSGSYTNLYAFGINTQTCCAFLPEAGLVQGSDGNFYGTTQFGTNGYGSVFRISPSGSYTNLHSFTGSDGDQPFAKLVQGSDGNFYGTTFNGGSGGDGVLFGITPSGTLTVVSSVGGHLNVGIYPYAGLVQGTDGNFYGTTEYGNGHVYKLVVPLNPPPWPINQITGVQPSGSDIVFGIPSIAGETYQLQFSSSMNPTNWVNVPGVSVTNSIGALLTLTNFGGAVGPQGFYRFAITP